MSIRKPIAISFLSSSGIMLLNLVNVSVISRLLTPPQIGAYSVGFVVVAVGQVFRDFGVGTYIVQEKDLTQDRLRSAFGVMLIGSCLLASLLAIASRFAANFYTSPETGEVVLMLALNLLLAPFGAITIAYLQREMEFGKRAVIDFCCALASMAASTTLAYLGFGHMSLVWASVTGNLVTILVAAYYRPRDLPWLPNLREARRVASFGLTMSSASLTGYLNGSLPDLLLGKLMGMEAVAQFNRGIALTRYFFIAVVGPIANVFTPHVARASRAGNDVRAVYLEWVNYLLALAWPFLITVCLLAKPLITTLYGHQWATAAEILPYLCVGTMLWVPFLLCPSIFGALGRANWILLMESAHLPVKALSIVLFVPWGMTGIAVGFVFGSSVGAIVYLLLLKRALNIGIRRILALVPATMPPTIFAALGAISGDFLLSEHGYLLRSLAGGTLAVLGWGAALYFCKNPLFGFAQQILRERFQTVKNGGAPSRRDGGSFV